MKRRQNGIRALALVLGVLCVLLAGCAPCEPRPNLGRYRAELVGWKESGGYAACFARAAQRADTLLDRALARRAPGEPVAVVLDIDETCLSNWAYLQQVDFAIESASFSAWVARHDDPPLPPMRDLYARARSAGVAVFFVTGRSASLRAATERQLKRAGYAGWSGLFMKPDGYDHPSIVPFKSGVRRRLEAEGWTMILTVGDQWSDLAGGAAAARVKLPNPFYFIP